MKKKIITLMLSVAVSSTVIFNCSASTTQTEEPATTAEPTGDLIEFWGVSDPQMSAQQIIADELGYFEEEGANVKFQFLQDGTDMSSMMAGGTAQMCCESSQTSAQIAATGSGDIEILAPVANCGGTQQVVAAPGFEVTSAKDLEGATIAMSSGAGVQMAIVNMCKDLGVDFDAINFVYCGPTEQLASLLKGDVDALACWEPYTQEAIDQGGTFLFSGTQSELPEKSGDVDWMNMYACVQVNKTFLEGHEGDVQAILRALSRATDYINTNREEAVEIIAKKLDVDEEVVDLIMGLNTYSMEWDDTFTEGTIAYTQYMYDTKGIDNIPEFDTYNDSSYLEEVLPDLVTTTK